MSLRARVQASLAAQKQHKDYLDDLKKRQPSPPMGWKKPAYKSLEYREACYLGWISWQERERDHIIYESRRNRSLQTSHRYSMAGLKDRYPKPNTKAYTPEMSAIVDEDRNLNANADKAARFLMRQAYQKARNTRTLRITVSYIAKALNRSTRTIQRYLGSLVEEGYIKVEIIRSSITGMVACLEIKLLSPLFPEHHKQKWPQRRINPDATFLSDKQSQLIYNRKEDRNSWAIRCMNGVFRQFMKTKPILGIPWLPTPCS
jgi:hypothetical protein